MNGSNLSMKSEATKMRDLEVELKDMMTKFAFTNAEISTAYKQMAVRTI
jgi:hypothetical protein